MGDDASEDENPRGSGLGSAKARTYGGGERSKIKSGNLYIDPRSHLGLNFNKTRADMLALALSKPEEYFKLRAAILTAITEDAVVAVYDSYWNILGKGLVKNKDGDLIKITYVGKNGDPKNPSSFCPNLPEVAISKFAMSVAKQVQETSEEAIEMILPGDYLELAKKTTKNLTVASGANI